MKRRIPFFDLQNVKKTFSSNVAHLDDDVLMVQLPIAEMDSSVPFSFQFTTCTLVDRGEAIVTTGLQDYHLKPHSLFLVMAEQVTLLRWRTPDFSARCLFLSPEFLVSLNIDHNVQLYQTMKQCPLIDLNCDAVRAIDLYLQMLEAALLETDNPHKRKIVFHLTMAYFYGLGYHINPGGQHPTRSRSHQVTSDFLDLLQKHFRTQRKVSFYADLLHITPKYLSACVKECADIGALRCIERHTILYAQNVLANTDTSISQLSEELNFDSPSTFGKYFRAIVGIAPKEWRHNHRTQYTESITKKTTIF